MAVMPDTTTLRSAIVATGLSKEYGGRLVLDAISIAVPRGSVYGFVGPNGAGKSTTIRLLLGLQRPTSGAALVLGRDAGDPASLERIGALVEMPSLYPNLTGVDNLRVTALYRGNSRDDCERALALVGLTGAAHQKVKGYSLGMRQRLGLAIALVHEPELLILDEPTNGLDPAGILEMRALVRELAEGRGVTVFLSSHLLSEVQLMATHLAVLDRGRLRFEGTMTELLAQARPRLVLGVGDADRAAEFLRAKGIVTTRADGGRLAIDAATDADARRVNALLVGAGFAVDHLALETPSLESRFMDMTGAAQ